jgi:surface protein
MKSMFYDATAFNADISGWDVSQVTSMNGMFQNATSFNADISGWNVGKVTDMSYMFASATSFNADISGWNVGKVTNMNYMFYDATAFTRNLIKWDVGKVMYMGCMFFNATAFTRDLSKWDVRTNPTHDNFGFNDLTRIPLWGQWPLLNASLSNLTLSSDPNSSSSPIVLLPVSSLPQQAFNKGTRSYTASVVNTLSSIIITPTATDTSSSEVTIVMNERKGNYKNE